MGSLVSFVLADHPPTTTTTLQDEAGPPSHIPIPPPPAIFGTWSLSPSPSYKDNPFDLPMPSPSLQFYTAPSSPAVEVPSHSHTDHPPQTDLHIALPSSDPLPGLAQALEAESLRTDPTNEFDTIPNSNPHELPPEDPFPTADFTVDVSLDEEGLSTLEKIWLFSRSKARFHRIFIVHALPGFLHQVSPLEAKEYVLPLLSGLATDEDDAVKEALALELVPIIWWFFTHCQIVSDDVQHEDLAYPSSSTTTPISVQAFTPILGTLLLNTSGPIGGAARYAVVDILKRIRRADREENASLVDIAGNAMKKGEVLDEEPENPEWLAVGLFGKQEREMFEQEVLQQVVIGMGRLDMTEEFDGVNHDDYDHEMQWEDGAQVQHNERGRNPSDHAILDGPTGQPHDHITNTENGEHITKISPPAEAAHTSTQDNPYFPPVPHHPSSPSSSSTPSTPSSSTDTTASTPSSSSGSIDDGINGSAPPSTEIHSLMRHSSFPLSSPPIPEQQRPWNEQLPASSHTSVPSSNTNSTAPGFDQNSRENYPFFDTHCISPDQPNPPPDHAPSQDHLEHRAPQSPHSYTPSRVSPLPSPHDHGPTVSGNERHNNIFTIGPDAEMVDGTERGDGGEGYFGETQDYGDDYQEGQVEWDGDQAAVGRLSSMSLMAAVTASVSLDDETKRAFVKEVERSGHDPVYWVRREASYALGALAKVVPQEIVICSLLPLFDSLRQDSAWHVRHGALLALPAILPRLTPSQRRDLALQTILPLTMDEYPPVRLGVLEALGEVIYTFHQDTNGPPEELMQLFLGRKEDKRVRNGEIFIEEEAALEAKRHEALLSSIFGVTRPSLTPPEPPPHSEENALQSFYTDPSRPLICAFNYPAVALTLGRLRWDELREVYLDLALNPTVKVRRTIAASLGELAKIVGQEAAGSDLLKVWWASVRCEEDDLVRVKAVECVETFVEALTQEAREEVVEGLLNLWEEGVFGTWREREDIAKALVGLTSKVGHHRPPSIRGLLMNALVDSVAAVREAAINTLPLIWTMFAERPDVLLDLRRDMESLASSAMYRRRMTFVACEQALVLPRADGSAVLQADDDFWKTLAGLATDEIIGVRIGLARLIGTVYNTFMQDSSYLSGALVNVARQLSQDPSLEVQAYIPGPLKSTDPTQLQTSKISGQSRTQLSKHLTFSRPPPISLPQTTVESMSPVSDQSGVPAGIDRLISGRRSHDSNNDSRLLPNGYSVSPDGHNGTEDAAMEGPESELAQAILEVSSISETDMPSVAPRPEDKLLSDFGVRGDITVPG